MNEPLDPALTMRTMLLFQLTDACAALPASSRALLSTALTRPSNDSNIVRPWCWCGFSFFFFFERRVCVGVGVGCWVLVLIFFGCFGVWSFVC